jgi:hypothetical protein
VLSRGSSDARVEKLRAQGWYVRKVALPSGMTVVVKSRRPIRFGHHSPYAVIYGGNYLKRTPRNPNPWGSERELGLALQYFGGHIWDAGLATLDEAIAEARSAGARHDTRVVVYDQSNGKVVHTHQAGRQSPSKVKPTVVVKRLPPFTGPERWTRRQPDGELSWLDIFPSDAGERGNVNDQRDRFVETVAESDARRERLRKDGWSVARREL